MATKSRRKASQEACQTPGAWRGSEERRVPNALQSIRRRPSAAGAERPWERHPCLISLPQFCLFVKDSLLPLVSPVSRALASSVFCSPYMRVSLAWCVAPAVSRDTLFDAYCRSATHQTTNIHFEPLGLPLLDTDRPP